MLLFFILLGVPVTSAALNMCGAIEEQHAVIDLVFPLQPSLTVVTDHIPQHRASHHTLHCISHRTALTLIE